MLVMLLEVNKIIGCKKWKNFRIEAQTTKKPLIRPLQEITNKIENHLPMQQSLHSIS